MAGRLRFPRTLPRFLEPARRPVAGALALGVAAAAGAVALVVAAPPSQAAADCSAGYVALTFDDGPNGSTGALINALRNAGAKGTFFNVGQNVQNNRAAAQAQTAAGMWIGNHSWNHAHMTSMSQAQMQSDLSQTQQAIQQATGVTARVFRPPYGETNGTLQNVAAQLGLRHITWDVDSRDWAGASTAQIVQAANSLQAGGSILMHDGYQTTRDAIPQIVSNLGNRGLCPGMISPSTGRAVAPDGTPPTQNPPTQNPPTQNPPTQNPPTQNPPTQNPPGGACSASVSLNQWQGGFVATVRVTAGSSGLNGWRVNLTVPSGATIVNAWNVQRSGNSGAVQFTNVQFNGQVGANASTEFGFQGTGGGSGMSPTCAAA
jgi:peptidoglycan/xylan/chitin deacetylase (PgdA/CDA1 family)